jgi:DNA-binding GntR family transcriptional regulator
MSKVISLVGEAAVPGGPVSAAAPRRRAAGGAVLREQAYTELKRRILSWEFRPGEAINEAQIGAALGLGRTPVHQALHRLEVEGLVCIMPRKGVLVTALSLNDALDMIEVRSANELLCVTLAAERAHPGDFKAMREIIEATPQLIAQRDLPALMALDLRFHLAISASSRNRVLADLLRNLHEKQARFWFYSLSDPTHLNHVYDEHRQMLDALERRDVDAVREATRHHIEQFRSNIIRTL